MKEKIAVFSAILLGMTVGLFATVSLIIDAFIVDNLLGTLLDLAVMGFAYMTAWIGIRYASMEKMVLEKLDMEWDYKIKPVVNLLRETIGRVNTLEVGIMATERKIETTLDYVTNAQNMDVSSIYVYPGASFKFMIKVLVLIVFTFSSLVYAAEFPLGIIHYYLLVIYLVWWGLITSEYKLFDNKNAWMWALVAIMFVPTLGIILDAIIGVNSMIGILFFLMLIYVYSYYSWAAYITIGFKLIDLTKVKGYITKHASEILQEEREKQRIDPKWISYGILICVIIAGAVAVWIFAS